MYFGFLIYFLGIVSYLGILTFGGNYYSSGKSHFAKFWLLGIPTYLGIVTFTNNSALFLTFILTFFGKSVSSRNSEILKNFDLF